MNLYGNKVDSGQFAFDLNEHRFFFFLSTWQRERERDLLKKFQFSTYSIELNDQILYEILISISLFIETPLKVKRTKISLAQKISDVFYLNDDLFLRHNHTTQP